MRITIFGSGYVGLVTGACLADAGNHVVCVDVDRRKVEMLSAGEIPIHEPGLESSSNATSRPDVCASPPMPRKAWSMASFS